MRIAQHSQSLHSFVQGLLNALNSRLRPLYSYGLAPLIRDKCATEVVLSQILRAPSSSFPSTAHRPRNFPSIYDADPLLLPLELFSALPHPFLMPTDLTIVRPALLIDTEGQPRGSISYRVLQSGRIQGTEGGLYRISFQDLGELLAGLASGLPNTAEWRGCQLLVGY